MNIMEFSVSGKNNKSELDIAMQFYHHDAKQNKIIKQNGIYNLMIFI